MNIAILIPEMGGGGAERVAKNLGDYYSRRGENVFYFLGDSNTQSLYSMSGEVIQTNIKPISTDCNLGRIYFFYQILKSGSKCTSQLISGNPIFFFQKAVQEKGD